MFASRDRIYVSHITGGLFLRFSLDTIAPRCYTHSIETGGKMVPTKIYIEEQYKKLLRIHCAKSDLSMSGVINGLIAQYLKTIKR